MDQPGPISYPYNSFLPLASLIPGILNAIALWRAELPLPSYAPPRAKWWPLKHAEAMPDIYIFFTGNCLLKNLILGKFHTRKTAGCYSGKRTPTHCVQLKWSGPEV